MSAKKVTQKKQQELNKELREASAVLIEKSKENIDTHQYYLKFKKLIEQGATCRITKALVAAVFRYKFTICCINAKARVEEREDYKDKEYLFGDKETAYERLKEKKPDQYKAGLEVVEAYLKESMKLGEMAFSLAPVVHRKKDKGNYDWDNIEILSRQQHEKLTKKPQTLIEYVDNGVYVSVLPSIRSLTQEVGKCRKTILKQTGQFILEDQSKTAWYDQKMIRTMKKPFKTHLKHCEQQMKENKGSSEYNFYNLLYEICYSVGISMGLIKEK